MSTSQYNKLTNTGYSIKGLTDELEFNQWIESTFPGLDLTSITDEIEKQSKLCRYNYNKKISINKSKSSLSIRVESTQMSDVLFHREFIKSKNGITISHNAFYLPENCQDNSIAKPIFKKSFRQYKKMQAQQIKVRAVEKGTYAWAKFGFYATSETEVIALLKSSKKHLTKDDFKGVKAIYDAYLKLSPQKFLFPIELWADLPGMKEFLIQTELEWEGVLDLQNKAQCATFEAYVN